MRFPPRVLILFCCALFSAAAAAAEDKTPNQAYTLLKAALDYWRDESSHSVAVMTIHRPDWERRIKMEVWTKGDKNSLVRVLEPKKDTGSGTLLKDSEMWSFSPKINRVVKIPSSMMNQSWMGSDFSNNDIARADKLLTDYKHRLIAEETHEGHRVSVIEAVPKEDAAVVWGKEILKIRDDHIALEHAYYDQDNVLVKKMETLAVKTLGGKPVAAVERVYKAEQPDEWTRFELSEARFKLALPDYLFTLSNLRNPR